MKLLEELPHKEDRIGLVDWLKGKISEENLQYLKESIQHNFKNHFDEDSEHEQRDVYV